MPMPPRTTPSRPTLRRLPALILPLLLALGACTRHPARNPTLDELKQAAAADDAERVGGWLMDRPVGVNPLDLRETPRPLIAVHGYGSEGTEWVGPLATLDAPGTGFYRWDWMTCPDAATRRLQAAIAEVAARPGITGIRIIGHSYGGLISALAAHRYTGALPLEVHVVAAPLAGVPRMARLCGAVKPGDAGGGPVTITQWRTVKAQDGAFRELETDPQVVDWAGSDVVQLPAEWSGGRLGHNRALQWVAEAWSKRAAAAPSASGEAVEPGAGSGDAGDAGDAGEAGGAVSAP